VATEPTELITFDGAPNYVPVGEAADLLYADNSDGQVLLLVPTNESYVLVSGRWYKAKSLEGPWTFVRPDQLPPSFAKIPPEGLAAGVRPFVPGTTEATDALADTQIPQTTAVKRDQKLEVTYDGEPKWEPIGETGVSYAVNTPNDVFQVGSRFYCCFQGVWFSAASPTGPWSAADSVPNEIYAIPPTSPKYNVTFVKVVESTPETVTCSYTSGYDGEIVSSGVVVYGTAVTVTVWPAGPYYWGYYPPYYWGYGYYPPYYGGVAFWAHIGGFLFGLLITLPFAIYDRTRMHQTWET